MLIKKAPDLTYKDVTPKGLYVGRSKFPFRNCRHLQHHTSASKN